MKKSILKTTGVVAILVLIIGDRIGNSATDVQTAKYQEPHAVVTTTDEQMPGSLVIIEDEPVALSANPFGEAAGQSVSDNSLE